jgi:hypothetical protein
VVVNSKAVQAPGPFYNYTNDGKVVTYNANSEIEKINASLHLGGGNTQQMCSQRETLLHTVDFIATLTLVKVFRVG